MCGGYLHTAPCSNSKKREGIRTQERRGGGFAASWKGHWSFTVKCDLIGKKSKTKLVWIQRAKMNRLLPSWWRLGVWGCIYCPPKVDGQHESEVSLSLMHNWVFILQPPGSIKQRPSWSHPFIFPCFSLLQNSTHYLLLLWISFTLLSWLNTFFLWFLSCY